MADASVSCRRRRRSPRASNAPVPRADRPFAVAAGGVVLVGGPDPDGLASVYARALADLEREGAAPHGETVPAQ